MCRAYRVVRVDYLVALCPFRNAPAPGAYNESKTETETAMKTKKGERRKEGEKKDYERKMEREREKTVDINAEANVKPRSLSICAYSTECLRR